MTPRRTHATRRSLTTAAMVAGLTAALSLPAWAGDCVNASRPQGSAENLETVGNWIYFEGFGWSFIAPGTDVDGFSGAGASGNFKAGEGHALLDGTPVCDSDVRQDEHGIQRADFWVPCD